MRANEFLVEATLSSGTTFTSWPTYLQGLLSGNISLGTSGEKAQGLELDLESKNAVKSLSGEEPLKVLAFADIEVFCGRSVWKLGLIVLKGIF